jgi:hypothetical protein
MPRNQITDATVPSAIRVTEAFRREASVVFNFTLALDHFSLRVHITERGHIGVCSAMGAELDPLPSKFFDLRPSQQRLFINPTGLPWPVISFPAVRGRKKHGCGKPPAPKLWRHLGVKILITVVERQNDGFRGRFIMTF